MNFLSRVVLLILMLGLRGNVRVCFLIVNEMSIEKNETEYMIIKKAFSIAYKSTH